MYFTLKVPGIDLRGLYFVWYGKKSTGEIPLVFCGNYFFNIIYESVLLSTLLYSTVDDFSEVQFSTSLKEESAGSEQFTNMNEETEVESLGIIRNFITR